MVLFDEGSAAMVLKQKKLFQASASWVTCGSSSTNCHAYQVWMHRVRLIISSNRWGMELRNLPRADAEWLVVNSVFVYVDSPLWEDDAVFL